MDVSSSVGDKETDLENDFSNEKEFGKSLCYFLRIHWKSSVPKISLGAMSYPVS
jgi:hypothetical protein